jgi:hypothetical protein
LSVEDSSPLSLDEYFKFNLDFVEDGREEMLGIEKTMKRKQNIGYKTAFKKPKSKNLWTAVTFEPFEIEI